MAFAKLLDNPEILYRNLNCCETTPSRPPPISPKRYWGRRRGQNRSIWRMSGLFRIDIGQHPPAAVWPFSTLRKPRGTL